MQVQKKLDLLINKTHVHVQLNMMNIAILIAIARLASANYI